jgi:P-type E1-E2 ATPase
MRHPLRMIRADVPEIGELRLEHLVIDLNGTLADRGALIVGVEERLLAVRELIEVRVLSADTFGTLQELARRLRLDSAAVSSGVEKLRVVESLGAERCAAIGNGRNDVAMLRAVRLGIAVLGPEGASAEALRAADLVCPSILAALDLLLDPRALAATLRP